jgi:hypothetical protein
MGYYRLLRGLRPLAMTEIGACNDGPSVLAMTEIGACNDGPSVLAMTGGGCLQMTVKELCGRY